VGWAASASVRRRRSDHVGIGVDTADSAHYISAHGLVRATSTRGARATVATTVARIADASSHNAALHSRVGVGAA
jgi:hypothetical protein